MADQAVMQHIAERVEYDPFGGCWLWSGHLDKSGYGQLRHRGRSTSAHRLSYAAHVGPPGNLFVCHRCDVPACVNPAHLFLGTSADNMQDMVRKGRRTAHTTLTKLAASEIKQVVALRRQGASKRHIARVTGRSLAAVTAHLRKRSIEPPAPVNIDPRAVVLDRIEHDPFGGCWLWAGSMFNNGYARICVGHASIPAHRLAYAAFRGEIPDGQVAVQSCGVRVCCNPNHLFLEKKSNGKLKRH